MKRRVLLTGFERFGGDQVNPSGELARSLNGVEVKDVAITGRILPVEYTRAVDLLFEWIREIEPAGVICTGLNSAADMINVEHIAYNEDAASIPDNSGDLRTGIPICPDGPRVLQSTLPGRLIVESCLADGIPARESWDAGRYVCNHVFYQLLNKLNDKHRRIPSGFIHVPNSFSDRSLQAALMIAVAHII